MIRNDLEHTRFLMKQAEEEAQLVLEGKRDRLLRDEQFDAEKVKQLSNSDIYLAYEGLLEQERIERMNQAFFCYKVLRKKMSKQYTYKIANPYLET